MTKEYHAEELNQRVVVFDCHINPRSDDAANAVDRYLAVIDGDFESCIAMSAYPFHPQGVGMHCEIARDYYNECMELGQRVLWDVLPKQVQRCILQDLRMNDNHKDSTG